MCKTKDIPSAKKEGKKETYSNVSKWLKWAMNSTLDTSYDDFSSWRSMKEMNKRHLLQSCKEKDHGSK